MFDPFSIILVVVKNQKFHGSPLMIDVFVLEKHKIRSGLEFFVNNTHGFFEVHTKKALLPKIIQ
jgi:hypothetical protein